MSLAALNEFKVWFSQSAQVQAWLSADSAEAARARLFLYEVDPENVPVFGTLFERSDMQTSIAEPVVLEPSGVVDFRFELPRPEAATAEAEYTIIMTERDLFRSQVIELMQTSGAVIRNWEFTRTEQCDPEELGRERWEIEGSIAWGFAQ